MKLKSKNMGLGFEREDFTKLQVFLEVGECR
jgi:hypothetical protein